ncbi:MAG TPA: PEP-CTERM sorting domain-containing protein [Phycisphaerae bacterium]|nr:PEP-CTERM sorting domain-containing protein [Phycisphaerae bacterium]
MRITALITGLVLLAVSPANAVFIGFDSEPNDTTGTADPLISDDGDFNTPTCTLSADVGFGTLAAGNVDFYSVFIPAGCILTATTTPLSPFGSVPDTLLAMFNPALIPGSTNDDAGNHVNGTGSNRGSTIRFLSLVSQTYQVGVTGFLDSDFNGTGHTQNGDYLLTVSITPEPATIGLLVGGLLIGLRRRVR